ncbi:hypothetical protein Goshw_004046 [Gossypium schwendimanii]|uniref:Uncharacterized protein n=1 Tax=Gossypium schwendimanii TaxID=34291 RepID=A0A7J9N5S8_GOSSC|nr:hypothetical protein [Gossypium schwendimanii]
MATNGNDQIIKENNCETKSICPVL